MKLSRAQKYTDLFFKYSQIAAPLWLALPFIIFVFGWIKWYFAIPIAAAVLYGVYGIIRSTKEIHIQLDKKSALIFILSLALLAVWVTASGIGCVMYQNDDFYYRNAILKDLINNKWPVIFENADIQGHDSPALVYYFAFFLPSALAGKLFGFKAALLTLWLWSFIGIVCIWSYLVIRINKISLNVLWMLTLFGGMDIIGCLLLSKPVTFTEHIEWWVVPWQYSSMSTQLFWVFNQSIPAWLATVMLITQPSRKCIVVIAGLLLLYSPMPFVGFIVFLVYYLLKGIRQPKQWAREIFTPENVLGGGAAGITSFLFLSCNIAGQKVGLCEMNWKYFLFIFLEFGVTAVLLFRYKKKDPLFYISVIMLTVLPLFTVGNVYDFCMRASIVPLFILTCFSIDALEQEHEKLRKYILVAVLCICSVASLLEINRSFVKTFSGEEKGRYAYSTVLQSHDELKGNFLGDSRGNIFFDVLAKNNSEK